VEGRRSQTQSVGTKKQSKKAKQDSVSPSRGTGRGRSYLEKKKSKLEKIISIHDISILERKKSIKGPGYT